MTDAPLYIAVATLIIVVAIQHKRINELDSDQRRALEYIASLSEWSVDSAKRTILHTESIDALFTAVKELGYDPDTES